MIKGFAYIAWQIENNSMVEVVATTPRYIAQEADHLLASSEGVAPRCQNSRRQNSIC
jgi:hypothetical protein